MRKKKKTLDAKISQEEPNLALIAKQLKGRDLFPEKTAAAKKLFQDEGFVKKLFKVIAESENKKSSAK